MNRLVAARFVEALFRDKVLFLVPLIVVLGYGVFSTFKQVEQFTSRGSVLTERSSFVGELTGLTGSDSYLSPSQAAADQLNGLLQTDVFLEGVLVDAGIELAPAATRPVQLNEARDSVYSSPTSENLLVILATTADPAVSQRLAEATIDRFIEFKIAADIDESTAAAEFFAGLAEVYEAELTAAQATLTAYMGSVAAATVDDLSPTETLEIERLADEENSASERLSNALDSLEAARLAELQARTDVQQSLLVVDPPQQPESADGGLTATIISLMIFGVAGVILGLIGPALAAILDKSVLFEEELSKVAHVIGVTPLASRRELKPTQFADASPLALGPAPRRELPASEVSEPAAPPVVAAAPATAPAPATSSDHEDRPSFAVATRATTTERDGTNGVYLGTRRERVQERLEHPAPPLPHATELDSGYVALASWFDPSSTNRAEHRHRTDEILRATKGLRGRFLEIGCLTGVVAGQVVQQDPDREVVGIDPLEEALEIAASRGVHTVHAPLDTALEMFPDASFDHVIAANVLNGLDEPYRLLSEARRVLHLHGTLIVSVPNKGSLSRRTPLAFGGQPEADDPLRFDQDSIASLLDSSGFQVREVRGDVVMALGDWRRGSQALKSRAMARVARGVARNLIVTARKA